MTQLIPALIPADPAEVSPPVTPHSPPSSLYDVAIGGVGFMFANTADNPMIRETVPLEKTRVDQAVTPGEQTLTNWWIKSQDSFHGGAGQLQLEPAFPTPFDHIRFDVSKNVDVFTPGQVSRLPDTTTVDTGTADQLVTVNVSGADAIAYLTTSTGVIKLVTSLSSPVVTPFTGITGGGVKAIATDGANVYAATATDVWRVNPATPAVATKLATYAAATSGPVLGWVKSRLMLGVSGAVYELDVTQTGVTLGATQLRYQHPVAGWTWRCFSTAPGAIVAAGDAGGQSVITQFSLNNVAGAPVLQVAGDIAPMPIGERVLSMANVMGSFLVLGTSKGIRVGTFNTYTGALAYGPLTLSANDPVIPAVALTSRDRFMYAAGLAYDEGGLIRLDLGLQTDQSGRYAWAPDLITPTFTATAATAVATLPVSGLLTFAVPGTGILVEGTGPGQVREAWLKTSRIRYGTTEPKLFKLGRVRGDLSSGEIQATAFTPYASQVVATVGFDTVDPDEFRLLPGLAEWMQIQLRLEGQTARLTSYQVKALPGTRRQRHMQFVLAVSDNETTRSGQKKRDMLSSRDRLAELEEMDASGDEVILEEFTPVGVISTRVVIEQISYRQSGRPTGRSDIGGTVVVLLRTVES